MASGDFMFDCFPAEHIPPSTNFPTPDLFNAAEGQRLVLDFVGSGGAADEVTYFEGRWPPNYDGGGVDIFLDYSTDGTSVGAVEWEVSMEVVQDQDDQDAGGQTFGTVTNIADTPSTATANINDRTAVGSITHANCGSPSPGDRFRLRLARDHDHATNTDDAQFHGLRAVES